MPQEIISALATTAHQIGSIVLTGSLFFLLFVVRPASRQSLGVRERQEFFLVLYRYMFHWLWFALLLIWSSGLWQVRLLDSAIPLPIQIMLGGGALVSVLTILGQIIRYFHLTEHIEGERWPQAGRLSSLVRVLMAAALLASLVSLLAGVAAPYLVPSPTG
jgi:uncharacterized membrane protein